MAGNKKTGEWIALTLGIGLILALFQAGSDLQGNKVVFPGTGEIGKAFLDLIVRGETWREIGVTMLQGIQTILLSAVAGTLLGIAEGLIPYLHALLKPLHTLLRSMPMIVVAVVVMVMTLFSENLTPLLSGCAVLIPMISEAAYEGCVRIDPDLTDVYRLDSGISPRILLRVYLPLISGYMRQAFVNACGMGLKIVVTAEFLVKTAHSLGQAVFSRRQSADYAELFAYALIMVLMVLALTGIPAVIIRMAGRQKKGEVTSG